MTEPLTIRSMAGFLQPTSDLPPEGALIVRPSSYASWSLCAYRLLLQDHPLYDSGSNEPPGFGTWEHAVISEFIINGSIPESPEDTLAIGAKALAEREEDIFSYASEEYLLKLAVEVKFAFMAWFNVYWKEVGSKLEVLAVEERVLRGLGVLPSGREVWMSGAPDLVVVGEIDDWKTASRGWKKGKAQANVVQIASYAWLSEHRTQAWLGRHVVYDRSKRTWTWEDTTIQLNPGVIRTSLRSMWDMARSLDAEVGVATPHSRGNSHTEGRSWHCTPAYCGAWNACDFRHLMPDGRGNEVRPPIRWDA